MLRRRRKDQKERERESRKSFRRPECKRMIFYLILPSSLPFRRDYLFHHPPAAHKSHI